MNLRIIALSLILTLSLAVLLNAFPDVYAAKDDKKKYAEEAKQRAIKELTEKQAKYKAGKEKAMAEEAKQRAIKELTEKQAKYKAGKEKPCFKGEYPGSFTASKPC